MRKSGYGPTGLTRFLCLLLVYVFVFSSGSLAARKARATTSTPDQKSAQRGAPRLKKKGGRRDGELLIRFKPNTSQRDMDTVLAGRSAYGGKRLRGGSRLQKLSVGSGRDLEAMIAELATNPVVDLVEPNYLVTQDQLTPNDPQFTEQWALHNSVKPGSDINILPAWATTTGSPRPVIAIIDSGIDFTHPDLIGSEWSNQREQPNGLDDDNDGLIDDSHGWDWVNNTNEIKDVLGHGTAVAGIIAAEGNNGVGITGVMWHSSLMSLRVLDDTGTGNVSDAVEAIDYAIAHGAQIINCSWGTDEESQILRDAIVRAMARGILVVTSAGNDGRNLDSAPYYPASFNLPNVIAVAATDNQDRLASWSNFSSADVDVAAPGVNILTTKMGGGYQTSSGTSVAVPFVTGIAGLIKTAQPLMQAEGLKAAILQGARQLTSLHGQVSSSGIVDAGNTLAVSSTLPPSFGTGGGNSGGGDPTTGGGNGGAAGGTGGGTGGEQGSAGGGQEPSPGPPGLAGAPGSNLPNLDVARNLNPPAPKAPVRIRSNSFDCQLLIDGSPDPNCDDGGGGGGGNQPPVAIINGTYTGQIGTSIQFGNSSYDPDGYITSYNWNFGDGSSVVFGASPTHTYSANGTYTVTLTVWDNGGLSASDYSTATIAPSNQPPVARPGGPYSAYTFQSISFNGSTSSDPDGTIASYAWDFGDGYTATGATPFHTYSGSSTYTVSLTVTDNLGATNTATTTATISTITNQPPVADPGGPYSGPVNQNISLDGLGSYDPDGTISTYSWTFGDGASASGATPSHSYSSAGTYTVTLTVTDNSGTSSSASTVATVGNGSTIYTQLFDPINAVGGSGVDPFSRNFNWQLPIVGLPGRTGLNLGLGLSYNSLVWTKEGSAIGFNLDQGSPSPGFHLGFPTITSGANTYLNQVTYLMVSPSGSRTEFRPTATAQLYQTADSSYTQLHIDSSSQMTVYPSSGGQITFIASAVYPYPFQCTKVEDRNGNYINITYNTQGNLNTVTDTLGRVVSFNYDSAHRLISISQPWSVPTMQPWATFNYSTKVINTGYQGLALVGIANGSTISVLSQVGLPDGSAYTFTYNSYGQVNKITHLAADGHQLGYTSYDFGTTTSQTDCPRITARHDLAENWNLRTNGLPDPTGGTATEAITYYTIFTNTTMITRTRGGTPQTTTVIQIEMPAVGQEPARPTGSNIPAGKTVIRMVVSPSGWDKGMARVTETWWSPDINTASIRQRWLFSDVTQDDTSKPYIVNPRVTDIDVLDSNGNHKYSHTDYVSVPGTIYTLPSDLIEYDADQTTVLRKSHTDYIPLTLINQHIIAVPSAQYGYGAGNALYSHLGYFYDEQSLQDQASVIQHDTSYGTGNITGRANATRIRKFDVNSSLYLDSQRKYTITGTTYLTTDPANHAVTVSYADSFSDHTNRYTYAYLTQATLTETDGSLIRSSFQYDFDFGAITLTEDPKQAQQITTYDDARRLSRKTDHDGHNNVDGMYTRYVYPPSGNIVQTFTLMEAGKGEVYTAAVFDGIGKVRATSTDFPGSAGLYRGQYTLYDVMGNVIQQSRPTEMNGSWTPTGDDAVGSANGGYGWLFSKQTYDWKGRPLVSTNFNGTTKSLSYGGGSCPGCQSVTLMDEVGRKKLVTQDVLGRVTSILDYKLDQTSVFATTTATYNALDQVLSNTVTQGTSGVSQTTSMAYDGYGRLSSQHLPIFNMPGNSHPYGNSIIYTYNADDTVSSVTDSRKAKVSYGYNNRHLLTSTTYADPSAYSPPSGANDAGADPTPLDSGATNSNVSFTYDEGGNRATMTDALGTTAYSYDTWSHMTSETRTFTDLANYGSNFGTYSIDYSYNLAGQLASIRDPFRTAGANHTVSYVHDKSGLLTGINATGYKDGYWNNSNQWITPDVPVLASQITHRAWGATTHASYGNNLTMSATYNQQMQAAHFQVSSVYNNAPYLVIANDYQYNSDSKIRFVGEIFDNETSRRPYDRAYSYEDVGRLVEAYSGTQAQAFNTGQPQPTTVDRPYRQSYGYDVWGNLTNRTNKAWSQTLGPVSDTYLDDRNQNTLWQYDYAGNVRHDDNTQFLYDAVGRQTHMNQGSITNAIIIDEGFDGNGQFVKRREQHTDPNNLYDKTTYYVRSSVLGGHAIAEVSVSDGINKVNLYSPDGQLLAESDGSFRFVHKSPVTGTQTKVNTIAPGPYSANVSQNGAVYDPLAADVGLSDPFVNGYVNYVDFMANKTLYMSGGNMYDASGGCKLDGQAVPCNIVAQMLNNGSAELHWVPDHTRDTGWQPAPPGQPGTPNAPAEQKGNSATAGTSGSTTTFLAPSSPAPPDLDQTETLVRPLITPETQEAIRMFELAEELKAESEGIIALFGNAYEVTAPNTLTYVAQGTKTVLTGEAVAEVMTVASVTALIFAVAMMFPDMFPGGHTGRDPADEKQKTKKYLYTVGNTTTVKVRPVDIPQDSSGYVPAQSPPAPSGKSAFETVEQLRAQGLTGWVYRLPVDIYLPFPINEIADGSGVGGPHSVGHHTIYPFKSITFDEFNALIGSLGWIKTGEEIKKVIKK